MAIRLMGWVIALFSFVILLPILFSNLIPSIALLFMAFGMLQKDGLTTLLSALLGIAYCIGFLWLAWAVLLKLIAIF